MWCREWWTSKCHHEQHCRRCFLRSWWVEVSARVPLTPHIPPWSRSLLSRWLILQLQRHLQRCSRLSADMFTTGPIRRPLSIDPALRIFGWDRTHHRGLPRHRSGQCGRGRPISWRWMESQSKWWAYLQGAVTLWAVYLGNIQQCRQYPCDSMGRRSWCQLFTLTHWITGVGWSFRI